MSKGKSLTLLFGLSPTLRDTVTNGLEAITNRTTTSGLILVSKTKEMLIARGSGMPHPPPLIQSIE